MNSIDLTPFYRNSIGFDQLGSMINNALSAEKSTRFPQYNIEQTEENKYTISLALPGFEQHEIKLHVNQGVLTVKGDKAKKNKHTYLHHGIDMQSFERTFNLAEHIEVISADLSNGILTVYLIKEVPEALKPREILIGKRVNSLENIPNSESDNDQAA